MRIEVHRMSFSLFIKSEPLRSVPGFSETFSQPTSIIGPRERTENREREREKEREGNIKKENPLQSFLSCLSLFID